MDCNRVKPVAFWVLPERRPPRVNWLMVKVPPLAWRRFVFTPWLAESCVVRRPLDNSRLPWKELEPVPVNAMVPLPLYAEAEAYVVNSAIEKLAPPLNWLRADQVLPADLEATPLPPQFKLINPLEAVLEKTNEFVLKESEAT